MSTKSPKFEILLDLEARTYEARDGLTDAAQDPRPLPSGGMPWHLEIRPSSGEASELEVVVADHDGDHFNPSRATACSVLAVDAWITDKVFETHDDTIYVVRIVNTSTHYVAEDICVYLGIDPTCLAGYRDQPAVQSLNLDGHDLLEIQPDHQCIKCLSPGHYIDLQFVAIARGPRPGIFAVRACITYDLLYWTRSPGKTQARLEIEVHDECRPRRDPCRPPRKVPPDPGLWKPAPEPFCPPECLQEAEPECPQEQEQEQEQMCPEEPERPQGPDSEPECDCEPDSKDRPEVEPETDLSCGPGSAFERDDVPHTPPDCDEAQGAPPPSISPDDADQHPPTRDNNQCRPEAPSETECATTPRGDKEVPTPIHDEEAMEREEIMSNDRYHKKTEEPASTDKKGCAPPCSNADELMPITEDCRLPEGGMLEFSYTFRKGFIAGANKGGKCVYGRRASNGEKECRLESIDDTIFVLDVTNHSHFHLKHVRIHGVRLYKNHDEVNDLLPSGHPVAQLVPNAVYIGSLSRGETKWVALSFITRGVAPGCYSVKFCVDYDIEACTVSAAVGVEISCD